MSSRESDRSSGKTRVVIVGGGLAGMSAAAALADAAGESLQITVLEAKRITGGRAGSFTDPQSGESIDYCQHVAMGCCTNFIGLMQRSGLSDHFRRFKSLQFFHPDHPPSDFSPSKYLPPPLHLAKTITALTYLRKQQKSQIRSGLWRLMRTPTAAIRDVTAADWLKRRGQDEATMREFWDVILVSALGEQSSAVTMAAARKVFIDGFAAARGASDVLVPSIPLSDLFGVELPSHLRALGVQVRERCVVKQIEHDADSLFVELTSGERIDAEHTICAVPWYRVADILGSSEAATAIDDFDSFTNYPSSPITGLHLWFDREITQLPHAVMVGTLTQWLFRDPTDTSNNRSERYYQVVISASSDIQKLSKAELVDQVLAELRHAFTAAREAKLMRHRIVTDPQSVFSIRPEVDATRPTARTPLPWLHLAGDWTATGWPATMEGAVISGRLAANSVLEQLNLPPLEADAGQKYGWLARLLIKS